MRITILLFLLALITSCGSKTASYNIQNEALKPLYQAYLDSPDKNTLKSFTVKALNEVMLNPTSTEATTIIDASTAAIEEQNLGVNAIPFLFSRLKYHYKTDETASTLDKLSSYMRENNKEVAADVLMQSLQSNFKDYTVSDDKKVEISDIDAYIKGVGEKVFNSGSNNTINNEAAQTYVDACEAYALANPNSVAAPEFLYRASEVSRTLRSYSKTLSIYDWILETYPEYEKAATALFLKGFILDNDLKNIDAAKATYNEFLQKYPSNALADDVQFLIENIGKSDEEIMKAIEANKKES